MGEGKHREGRARRIAAAGFVACCLLAAAPAGAFSLTGLKNRMVDFLFEQISTPGTFEVQAETVEDAVDGATSLVGVTVSDSEGVWLTIDRAAFSWSPTRLLRGEVEINSLTISGLTVARTPIPLPEEEAAAEPEEEESEGFAIDWPRSPIAMRIDRVSLESISIAEGVAPTAIRFDGTGGARDEGDIQALKLSIRRTDDIEGVIDLDYERNFENDHLRLKLTAREAPGGMVAVAAGLPNDAASRVKLTADGPPEDWRVDLDAHVDEMLDATGEAQISYAGALSAVANFEFTPGPALGEAALVALAPSATLKVDAAEGENGVIDIRTAEVASPALSLTADGGWNRSDGSMDLAVVFAAERALAGLAEGVDFTRLGFDGKAVGAPDDLALTGDVALIGLNTAAADISAFSLNADVRKTGERITVKGAGQAEGLRLDQLQPEVLGAAELTLDAVLDGDAATLTVLKLDSRALNLSVVGDADLAVQSMDVSYQVAVPELGPVAGSYGVEASGAFTADGAASGTFTEPRVDGELALTNAQVAGKNLGGLTVAHEIALADALTADVTAAFRGSEFGDADLAANAVLDGDVLEATYKLTAPDLAPAGEAIGTPLAGALTVEGAAKGPTSALDLSGEARIKNASAAGAGLGQVTLTHVVALGEAIVADIDLALAESDYGDADISTEFTLAGDALDVKTLTADALGLSAEGAAKIDLAATTVDGQLGASGNLDALGQLLGTPLSGALQAEAVMSAPEGRQAASLNASLGKLSTDGAAIESVRLSAEGRDLLGEPSVNANIAATDVSSGDVRLQTVELDANGPLSALAIALGLQGEVGDDDLKIDGEALVDASTPTTKATIPNFAASLGEEKVALAAPLTVTTGGGVTAIKGLDLSLPDDASISGDATLHPNGAEGDIELDALKMATLQRLGAQLFDSGEINATAKFDTRSGPAFADIAVRSEGLSRQGAIQQSGKSAEVALDAKWDGRTANVDAKLVGPQRTPLTARASLPLRPTGSIAPAPPPGAQIDAALDWNGRIENIWSLVPASGHILRGETLIALKINGPIDGPTIGGTAQIKDGAYENLDLGTILTDLNVDTTIAEGRDIGLKLSASDGAGGQVDGTVSLALSGPNEGLDVQVSTNSATLVRRDDVTAKVQGDVAVTGPLNDLLVKAEIEIEGAEVRLVNSSPPGVATLGDVEIKGAEQTEEEDAEAGLVTLDVHVFAERKIFVRGRGLESEWKMDLNVTGPATDPKIVGAVERVRGGLDLLGKEFVLERGAVTFTGPADPMIDVTLTRETDDFIGRIVVTGTGSDPAIAFTSDPVVPEEEVLPQALFGRSSQSLSAAEGLQLALGVATLLDGGGGTLGNIRGAIGLDVLSLGTDEDGEQEVNVGSYVTEGVYVGAKQSLGGSSSVIVEIDILDNLTMDVETGATTGESVGLNWKYDF